MAFVLLATIVTVMMRSAPRGCDTILISIQSCLITTTQSRTESISN
jgi:hypothetical protein